MPVVVVTDSTANLSAELAAQRGIVVVPLKVVIGSQVHDEGEGGVTPALVAQALRSQDPVSTSRPAPALISRTYDRVAALGATEIVSVHISSEMSGTFDSALLAARESPVPVTVVDSRQVGVATGYAALSAVDVLDAGGSAQDAALAARTRGESASSLFYVDTLEHLRRGGRIGAAVALLGGALAVKPLLRITDGRIEPMERVRTSARALARLADLAVEAAAGRAVDVGVAHLSSPDRARELAHQLGTRLESGLEGREVWCDEVGAVLGAHVGPGLLAVCVAPRL